MDFIGCTSLFVIGVRNIVIIVMLALIFFYDSVEAKRGCCSWHGGVSGCSYNGKIICSDGTYSPSCTCTPRTKNIRYKIVTYV